MHWGILRLRDICTCILYLVNYALRIHEIKMVNKLLVALSIAMVSVDRAVTINGVTCALDTKTNKSNTYISALKTSSPRFSIFTHISL